MRTLRLACLIPLATLALSGCGARTAVPDRESVVLVHGLGRSGASMMVLSQRLQWAGYHVAVVSYDSRGATLSEQAARIGTVVDDCCRAAASIHFVGHSLGGLLIRRHLADDPPEKLGRVVLLAPPNQGSHFVDWLSDVPLATEVLGPVGRTLGTDSTDLPLTLPEPFYDMGIVAGTRSIQPIGPAAIPGPDDGIVSVEQTRIAGVPMVVIPRSHAFIMSSRHAADAVMRFLRTGTFGDEDTGSHPDTPDDTGP